MTLHLIPTDVAKTYEVHEWRNAAGVLSTAHPSEWRDVIDVLRAFEFRRSEVLKGGGRKSVIAKRIDSFLEGRGWKEKKFATKELFARGARPKWQAWGDQADPHYRPDWPTYKHHSAKLIAAE